MLGNIHGGQPRWIEHLLAISGKQKRRSGKPLLPRGSQQRDSQEVPLEKGEGRLLCERRARWRNEPKGIQRTFDTMSLNRSGTCLVRTSWKHYCREHRCLRFNNLS